jgi:hypothetical protein
MVMPEAFELSDFTPEKLDTLKTAIKSNFVRKRRSRTASVSPPSIVNTILKKCDFILYTKNDFSDEEKYAYLLLFMKSIHETVCNASLSLFPALSLDKKALKVLSTTLLDKSANTVSNNHIAQLASVNIALKAITEKLQQTHRYEENIKKFHLENAVNALLQPSPPKIIRSKL